MASALDLLPAETRAKVDAVNNPVPGAFPPSGLREDLLAIASAEAAGWLVKFPNDHWHNSATFSHDGVTVWWSHCWRAKSDAAPFREPPRLYSTLAEALEKEGPTHV